jgi:hypothetical protein
MTTHPRLNVTASRTAWISAGYTVYTDDTLGSGPHGMDELIFLGTQSGQSGDGAIAWAITEHQRRIECERRDNAEAANARAVKDLADAIRHSSEADALQRILGRLSEKTQYAVRQQLRA